MEFGTREILILLGIVILLGILLDGLRRVRHIQSRSLKTSKRKPAIFDDEGYDELPGELPTGEVRVKVRDEQTAEVVSDHIRQYRENNKGNRTSAYVDVRRPATEEITPADIPEPEIDTPIQESEPAQAEPEQSVSLDEFAIDDVSEPLPEEQPLKPEPRIEPTWEMHPDEQPEVDDEPLSGGTKPFWIEEEDQADHRPATGRNEVPAEPESETEEENPQNEELEVIVLHLMAKGEDQIDGNSLLDAFLANGLRFGDMGIFHRHEHDDGSGPVHFSVANMVKPGTFSLDEMAYFSTPGVTFFMALNELGNPLDSYNKLIKTSQALAKTLQGELKDENRSALTKQTIEHHRQQIIDYTRRSFTLSN